MLYDKTDFFVLCLPPPWDLLLFKEELLLGLPLSVCSTQGKRDGDPWQCHIGRQKSHLDWQGQAVQGDQAGHLQGEGVVSTADTRRERFWRSRAAGRCRRPGCAGGGLAETPW